MRGKSKKYAALLLALSLLPMGGAVGAVNISDNFTLLTEEEKATAPEPTDDLYQYGLTYQTVDSSRFSINLYYLDKLGEVIPGVGAALELEKTENASNASMRLTKGDTVLKSYDVNSSLSAFVGTEGGYKLYITGTGAGNAKVNLVSESKINPVSSESKTTISSDNYYSISNVTVDAALSFNKGSSVSYCLEAEEEGWYVLNYEKAAMNLAYISPNINGEKADYDVNLSCAVVYLEKGINMLTLEGERAGSRITGISLLPIKCDWRYDSDAKYIYLSGYAMPASEVGIMLADEGAAANKETISNVVQVTADKNGEFSAEFKYTEGFDGKSLVINLGGISGELTAPEIYQSGEKSEGKLKLTKENGRVSAFTELNNAFRGNNDNYNIIIAFYDAKGSLLGMNASSDYASSFTADIPENAAFANAFIWDSLTGLRPLAPSAGQISVGEEKTEITE